MQRKAKVDFRSHAAETDKAVVDQLWTQAKLDLDIARRQALVYSLYGSKQKSVMVICCLFCISISNITNCYAETLNLQDIPMVKVLQKQAEDAPYTAA